MTELDDLEAKLRDEWRIPVKRKDYDKARTRAMARPAVVSGVVTRAKVARKGVPITLAPIGGGGK